ncbi:MAG TPA: pyrroline-5-carboxylate reductase [Bacteroidales bacterium]|nr:pyrroline-5-carboxylate reductase [Bacteroidales bacterium]
MKNHTFSIIGGGNMGSAIAEGLIKSGLFKPENVIVSDIRQKHLSSLKEKGVQVISDNVEAVRKASIVLLAVKPYHVKQVLDDVKAAIDPSKQLLLSIAAGVTCAQIEEAVGKMPVFRLIPNTAIAIQESMTCISAKNVTPEQEELVVDIFNHLGKTVVIGEELMNAATVIGSCGTAFALRYLRASMQGGIEIGFNSELAQLISAQTILGATKLILESGRHPEQEIDKVTTPQGITIVGLNEMEHQGFSSALIKGVITSFNKLKK